MLHLLPEISPLLISTLLVHSSAFFPKPLPIFPVLAVARHEEQNRSPCRMQVPVLSARGISTRSKNMTCGMMTVKWITWRYREVRLEPWCNPLWLTGLKAPANKLWDRQHENRISAAGMTILTEMGHDGSWARKRGCGGKKNVESSWRFCRLHCILHS